MKIKFLDVTSEYEIDIIDVSEYNIEEENDMEILKKAILDCVIEYIEDNI
jgi:hypothetical protein